MPIVERELRVAARRPSTYRTRFLAALGMMAVWLFLLGIDRSASPAHLGQSLFIALGVLALACAMLTGVFQTADCLSEEKREGTLGLLFLTDLTGYDVVLGKLAATSLHSFYGLLAVLPLLALPVLMGGVTGAAFWRVALVLVVTLFLSLSLGMFVSAVSQEARQAMAGTLAGMLVLAGVAPALHWVQIFVFHRTWTQALLLPSPGFALASAQDSYYATRTGGPMFWASIEVVGCLGLGFLVLAAVLLPWTWQADPQRPKEDETKGSLGLADPEDGDRVRAWVQRGRHPFLWLATRQSSVGKPGRILLTVILAIWLCALLCSIFGNSNVPAFIVALFSSFALHVVCKLLLVMEATRQLSEDRRSGALELLLVSPLRESEILAGVSKAVTRRFLGWGLILAGVNVCLSVTSMVCAERLRISRGNDLAVFQELFLGGIVALFLDFKALGPVAMWMALRANKPHRAILGTLGRVLFPPWLGLFLLVFFMSQSRSLTQGAIAVVFGAWFGLGWVVDGSMAGLARAELRRGFRALLLETKGPGIGG